MENSEENKREGPGERGGRGSETKIENWGRKSPHTQPPIGC